MISSFFTSGAVPGSIPSLPTPPSIMQMLSHDPAATLEAWNADLPDITGTIWENRDPYVTDASYYGYIDWG